MAAPIVRQIAFYAPVDARGKWHAAWMITHTAACGVPVDLSQDEVIHSVAGDNRVHPIVCRRCLNKARAGVDPTGVKR
jgi:uncharacterized protein (UPF0128 family)